MIRRGGPKLLLVGSLAACIVACGGPAVRTAAPTALPIEAVGALPGGSCPREAAGFAADADLDGMSDACETALATAFAPILMQDAGDCLWAEHAESARIAGGYHYAVDAADDDLVRIAYLPGYLRDCGWSGAKCLLPGVDCRPHAGDSEAVIVEVRFDSTRARWLPAAIFLSAHCFDGESKSCRWYEGAELEEFGWRGTSPVVWVASGRHANYPTRGACDAGHYWLDACPGDALPVRYPVASERNVGSAEAPIGGDGCVSLPADVDSSMVATGAIECFWSDRPFRGWQGDAHPGVTPYRRYLDLMESR